MPANENLAWFGAKRISIGVSSSFSSRCSSSTVFLGRITSCFGISVSSVACASASRWPSVATSVRLLPSATNRMPFR